MGKLRETLRRPLVFVPAILVIILTLIAGGWVVFNLSKSTKPDENSDQKGAQPKSQTATESSKQTKPQSFAYTLVAYKGQVFGAKIPKGWKITDNESGIDIMDPSDSNTGSSGAVAVGCYGY